MAAICKISAKTYFNLYNEIPNTAVHRYRISLLFPSQPVHSGLVARCNAQERKERMDTVQRHAGEKNGGGNFDINTGRPPLSKVNNNSNTVYELFNFIDNEVVYYPSEELARLPNQ
jgi:hypothetical protein